MISKQCDLKCKMAGEQLATLDIAYLFPPYPPRMSHEEFATKGAQIMLSMNFTDQEKEKNIREKHLTNKMTNYYLEYKEFLVKSGSDLIALLQMEEIK